MYLGCCDLWDISHHAVSPNPANIWFHHQFLTEYYQAIVGQHWSSGGPALNVCQEVVQTRRWIKSRIWQRDIYIVSSSIEWYMSFLLRVNPWRAGRRPRQWLPLDADSAQWAPITWRCWTLVHHQRGGSLCVYMSLSVKPKAGISSRFQWDRITHYTFEWRFHDSLNCCAPYALFESVVEVFLDGVWKQGNSVWYQPNCTLIVIKEQVFQLLQIMGTKTYINSIQTF